ncbi:MAG: hypothetical protein LQ344_001195, partial [Seirophora lacunosa]
MPPPSALRLGLAILLLLFTETFASPLALTRLNLRAISSSDYSNLAFFEQFAAAAYCPLNNRDKAGGTKITCSAGNCPLVESNDVVSVYEFE